MVKAKARDRAGLHFGEKVHVWLRRNRIEGRTPDSVRSLAEEVGETAPRMGRGLSTGDPRLSIARKVARLMGESLDFLVDDSQRYPAESPGAQWESLVGSLSPDEKRAIALAMSRGPEVRRLLLAYADRDRSGPGGHSSTPTR